MKKIVFYGILLCCLMSCLSIDNGSSSGHIENNTPRFTGVINDLALNKAIIESYGYIKNKVFEDAVIGIANFYSPTKQLSDYFVDGLSKQIVDDEIFRLVDIGNLRIIDQEMSRQLSGTVSDETAKRIGQQFGTDFIIIGNIDQLGQTRNYRIKLTITNVETTQIQGIFYADIRSNTELAQYLPENSKNRNMPLENSTNPEQRIYYFRNITEEQFNQLFTTFFAEATGRWDYFNANLRNGGTSDPYIEYAVKSYGNYSISQVIFITIAGPYYSEVYTFSYREEHNPGATYQKDRIWNRFNIEKSILNEKYGNPNISMFFKQ
jgi:hypothetical protein